MKTIALSLLLVASPLLAGDKPLMPKPLMSKAVYEQPQPLVIRQTANQSYRIISWTDAKAEPVYWVTADGCAWDRTDSTKPARLLGCAAKPDVLRKIRDESRLNRPVVVPKNERLVKLLDSVPAQHADNPLRKEIR